MAQPAHLDPSPFFLPGSNAGVLLIHGFTGSPPELRPVADYLNARGFTVSAPLLPGHGTRVEDMDRCRWSDWVDHVEDALIELQRVCQPVAVGGLSMGSLLALHAAARHPELAAVVAFSPAVWIADPRQYLLPVVKHFIRKQPKSGGSDIVDRQALRHLSSYDENPTRAAHQLLRLARVVRAELPQVTSPLLVFHGARDHTIRPDSPRYTLDHAGSRTKRLVTLANSGHCLTVDQEWEEVAELTCEFLLEAMPASAVGTAGSK